MRNWRKALQAAGWYQDEANSGPDCEVWKYRYGRGGEIKVKGELVDYMEGDREVLDRVVAITGMEGVVFTTSNPREWTTWRWPS
jgi:hypothetical protein